MLASEEKEFIVGGVLENDREDGRTCEEYRLIEVECGVVSNANGSARVRLGNTDILVAIKAETVQPAAWRPDEGTAEFSVDCSTHASPDFEGHGGEDLATELANVAENTILPGLDLKQLCILKGQQCWTLYIDAVINQCGGTLHDALCLAVLAALHDTRIPKVTFSGGDGEPLELEISDDPYDCTSVDISNVPVLVTLNKVGDCYVADASREEERCTDAKMRIAVDRAGCICYSAKCGRHGMEPSLVFDMLDKAKKVGSSLLTSFVQHLNSQQSSSKGLASSAGVLGFLR